MIDARTPKKWIKIGAHNGDSPYVTYGTIVTTEYWKWLMFFWQEISCVTSPWVRD